VRDTHCVRFSHLIGIGPYILASSTVHGTNNGGGAVNDKLLEDAFEAFLGAIYLDLGYAFSRAFITRLLDNHVDLNSLLHDDNYKDILMRYAQNKGIQLPEYKVISQEGPPHKRVFTIQVYLNIGENAIGNSDGNSGSILKLGIGKGNNKRNAEQEAAMNTLALINDDDLKDIAGRDS
jgi:ribonuclease-3